MEGRWFSVTLTGTETRVVFQLAEFVIWDHEVGRSSRPYPTKDEFARCTGYKPGIAGGHRPALSNDVALSYA